MQVESSYAVPREFAPARPTAAHAPPVAPGALRALTDIAEEITFSFSQRADNRRLTDRKLEPRNAFPALTHVELVAFLADTHEGEVHAKLLALTAFLSGLAERSAAEMQAHVETAFATPTQQYAALMYARDHVALADGAQQNHATLSTLCAQYEREYADVLNADVHALPYARAYASAIGAPPSQQASAHGALIGAYREAAIYTETLADVLKVVTDHLRVGTLAAGLAQMTHAAGEALRDMGQARGGDLPRVATLVQDLSRLAIVAAALDTCADLHRTLVGHAVMGFDPDDYLHALVRIVLNEWPTSTQFRDLASTRANQCLPASIAILQNASAVCRALPVHLHVDSQARDRLTNAAQAAIDDIVAIEDTL